MEVAIAFAVSWNPLVKSKARAVATTRARITKFVVTQAIVARATSRLLEDEHHLFDVRLSLTWCFPELTAA